jgi:hypothetical protein
MVQELLTRVPTLKLRGARRLYESLCNRLPGALETGLVSEHDVASEFMDDIVLDLCAPFLSALVMAGGQHPDLDSSPLATNFATMAHGIPMLELLLEAGYLLDQEGKGGAFSDRCLACPQCCLNDGVASTGDRAMRFSAQHAAAASGHDAVLSWLEQRQPPHPTARSMLFRSEYVDCQ